MEELIFHADVLSRFNEELYSNIFETNNITSKKKAIVIEEYKYYGYYMEKGNINYFCPDTHILDLPFKIVKMREVDYKGEVFNLIQEVTSITIPSIKKM